MKTGLTLSAFVVATMLIVVCGCTDPETIAKHSAEVTPNVERTAAPREMASDATDRSPAVESEADPSEADPSETGKQPESSKSSGRNSPRSGKRDGRGRLNPDITSRAAGNRGSSSDADVASNDVDADSETTEPAESKPPKEEYKFEFVSSTGEEGLEPGDTIPEITGKDLDNIKFNLSDYQGKVIMLDFWGDW